MGVRYILGVSACGSLQIEYQPGEIVVPDQLIDFTKGRRENSFFGNGLVAHVGVADPFSPELSKVLTESIRLENGSVHQDGSLITIEGPRFSTRAESHLYRQWGISIIGMTTSPEAFLAAEAEMAYACMAHVTDYDVWHEAEEPVSVEQVLAKTPENTRLAQSVISNMIQTKSNWEGEFLAHSAMRDALGLISDWSGVPNSVKEDLYPIIGKYL
jgi:5'-methylthioadenosine phosphorylase